VGYYFRFYINIHNQSEISNWLTYEWQLIGSNFFWILEIFLKYSFSLFKEEILLDFYSSVIAFATFKLNNVELFKSITLETAIINFLLKIQIKTFCIRREGLYLLCVTYTSMLTSVTICLDVIANYTLLCILNVLLPNYLLYIFIISSGTISVKYLRPVKFSVH
jgi:hypothetical protein